eukprot:scaffold1363_cov356-Prasinococcus_capsulatus_cf.AAC.5
MLRERALLGWPVHVRHPRLTANCPARLVHELVALSWLGSPCDGLWRGVDAGRSGLERTAPNGYVHATARVMAFVSTVGTACVTWAGWEQTARSLSLPCSLSSPARAPFPLSTATPRWVAARGYRALSVRPAGLQHSAYSREATAAMGLIGTLALPWFG